MSTDKKQKEKSLAELDLELNKLNQIGIMKNEFSELTTQLKGHLVLSQENNMRRMLNIGRQIIYKNEVLSLNEILHKIDNLNEDDLNRFIREFFHPEKFLTVIIE